MVEIEEVIEIVKSVGKLSALGPDDDMYEAGFASMRALELLQELEDTFEVDIPDDERFPAARTPRALHEILMELMQ